MQKDFGRAGQRRVVGGVCQLPVGADAGFDQSADHIDRQDGRLPDLPQRRVVGRVDRFGQVVRNERARTQS